MGVKIHDVEDKLLIEFSEFPLYWCEIGECSFGDENENPPTLSFNYTVYKPNTTVIIKPDDIPEIEQLIKLLGDFILDSIEDMIEQNTLVYKGGT